MSERSVSVHENVPKRHHLVPEFFLRRFAVDDKVELVSRADLGKRLVTSVRNALVQKHFYSVEADDGTLDPYFEKFFSEQVEGKGASALERVIDKRRSPAFHALRGAISKLAGFQYTRGEATRNDLVEHYKKLFQKTALVMTPEIIQAELQRQGEDPTIEEARGVWEFAQDTSKYTVDVSGKSTLHLQHALRIGQAAMDVFFHRVWRVIKFDEPSLITGDEPVAVVGSKLEPGEIQGLTSAPQIVYPTDPWHAILMIRPDLDHSWGWLKGTPEMARIINRHVAFGCHRFIVKRPGLPDPLEGLTVPEMAEATHVVGDYVLYLPRKSVAAAESYVAKYRKLTKAKPKR